MSKGLIFDIKRYAINDGPGIRLTVFFKGCPLNCVWCHNPESISPLVEKLYTHSKCIGCGECVKACPKQACDMTPQGIVTDKDKCELCGKCAEVCPTNATEISGRAMSVKEVMTEIEQEIVFFDQSGGGVTFSGGEPLFCHESLLELLTACKEKDIHCAVDTSGFAKTDILMMVAEKTDLFLFDLKIMDDDKHKAFTGVSNRKILENLTTLAKSGANINIRIPLIKGINDDNGNIDQTARFIADLPGSSKTVNILPYHNIAIRKYEKLGKSFENEGMAEPTEDELNNIIKHFEKHGVQAKVGG